MIDCRAFETAAPELAAGGVAEPERTALLAHAMSCRMCAALLDDLAAITDGVLLLAPEVEPPVGFESRAVAAMTGPVAPRPARGRALVAAAVAVVLISASAVVGRELTLAGHDPTQRAASAIIVAEAGTRPGIPLGRVSLVATPAPHVLVALDEYGRAGHDRETCQLLDPSGTWVTVGSWTYEQVEAGMWASGIDARLLTSRAMRMLDEQGTVMGEATFPAAGPPDRPATAR